VLLLLTKLFGILQQKRLFYLVGDIEEAIAKGKSLAE
jgi:hypothetical protein